MDKYNLEERYKDFPSRIEGELYEGFGLGGSGGITAPEGVQMKNVRVLGTDGDTQTISAELMVDDATDLPEADSITGYLLSGCVALVVHTGDIWVQDSTGEWFNQTKPAAPNATLNAFSASLTKTDTLKSEPTADILGKAGIETETRPDETPEDESLRSDEDDIDV